VLRIRHGAYLHRVSHVLRSGIRQQPLMLVHDPLQGVQLGTRRQLVLLQQAALWRLVQLQGAQRGTSAATPQAERKASHGLRYGQHCLRGCGDRSDVPNEVAREGLRVRSGALGQL
jgi:hypothetical protein